MKRIAKFLCILSCFSIHQVSAELALSTLADMISRADLIIVGSVKEIIDTGNKLEFYGDIIETENKHEGYGEEFRDWYKDGIKEFKASIDIEKTLKGSNLNEIDIYYAPRLDFQPKFSENERVIVFVNKHKDTQYRVSHGHAGKININKDKAGPVYILGEPTYFLLNELVEKICRLNL